MLSHYAAAAAVQQSQQDAVAAAANEQYSRFAASGTFPHSLIF